ncbi:universal stress protein [Halorubrum sp. Boch-26]|uniref:universal stress protein n=1 Tax=Halorubrum sp. Boch-26 TaxID=2994426 RepID=UPI00246895D1|nr:universal stress protein [Halorubrum sp. Boch-26]
MTRVLVPVAVLDGGGVSPGLMSLLGTVDVTVLGYHVLPEQTPPDQARLQFEERATSALDDLSQEFRAAGGAADHRLVFTHDRQQTIQRVAGEVDADAFAVTGTTGDVDRILVSLSGDVDVDRILSFVEALIGGRDIGVTLVLAGGSQAPGDDVTDAATSEGTDAADAADPRLEAAVGRLREAAIAVNTVVARDRSAFDALIDAVPDHDAVVMGERAPSFRSFVLGDESERVATASVGPVLVVRDRRDSDGADGADAGETAASDE